VSERRGGMRAIGAALPRIAAPILGKEGTDAARLIAQWPAIVGEAIAKSCQPTRLGFPRGERRNGTLRLRVASAAATEIQHREPVLIERINGYFGYAVVARIALVQGPPPLPDHAEPPVPRPLESAEQEALGRRLDGIADPELRAALERLGRAVIGSI
jgi:hypothetical protein